MNTVVAHKNKEDNKKMDKKLHPDDRTDLSYASFRRTKLKGQFYRVLDHLPIDQKYARQKKYGNQTILDTEQGRKILKDAIIAGTPFMAARFGTSEGAALTAFWEIKLKQGDNIQAFPKEPLDILCNNAGFFPNSKEAAWKWAELETKACADLDLLGVMHFLNEEWIFNNFCPQAKLMPNGGLASAGKGWATVLEGRKVLVVHPFTDTIKSQYENKRELIFPGSNALPEFDLKCVKAVQTIADQEDPRFHTWFDALDYMTDEVAKQDFDVALIGCGAYGFQLASRVKRMGKIAVHMGSTVQTLFGIKGARWNVKDSGMYNDAWVYPSEAETPKGFEKVENGAYWKPKE